ncbi:DNA repair exonuclease SbcCD nuclease subunit [Lachnospiraceae bacterium NE2001]|nr:DNA repair exonuclease SbcCD nuclease subunit [Lachnospiraceae bacterium NE2001]
MVKIFVTGDNHIGRKFDNYSIKDQLIESRFTCLKNMVEIAEKEQCQFFAITGDLFDNTYSIAKRDIKRVVEILASFSQSVLVLPGNHDFYSGNEQLWNVFMDVAGTYSNIIVFNEYKPYEFDCGDGTIVFYPAHCDSKHSETNRLDWMKAEEIDGNKYNIGIAHGALEGLAIDTEGVYFPMSRTELHSIPMDVWLLGHAHVTEPAILADEEVTGYTIFNPGTHEQLDLHNNTEGNAFVITLQNNDGIKKVLAKRVVTGKIRYFDEALIFNATNNESLEKKIEDLVKDYPSCSIVRLSISGSIDDSDYNCREEIYDTQLSRFLCYKINDNDLSEKITRDKIENEFSEIGFAAQFLEELLDDPVELQMAYDIVKSLK